MRIGRGNFGRDLLSVVAVVATVVVAVNVVVGEFRRMALFCDLVDLRLFRLRRLRGIN